MNKLISEHNKSAAAPSRHSRTPDCITCVICMPLRCCSPVYPVHVVAARLGHADPAVTLRVYSHVLREHTLGIGDIFAQAVKAPVSKSVSKSGRET